MILSHRWRRPSPGPAPFTDGARRVLAEGNKEAQRLGHASVESEHILLALVTEKAGVAVGMLRSLGTDLEKIRQRLTTSLNSGAPGVGADRVRYAPRATLLLEHAAAEAKDFGDPYVGTEHLLLAMLHEEATPTVAILKETGLSLPLARTLLRHGSTSRAGGQS
jgi:ATP-dependent Clp protease ATP-binding subunit ClpC